MTYEELNEKLTNKGVKTSRWTKGNYDRLYFKFYDLPFVKTVWEPKTRTGFYYVVDGEELTYTKSGKAKFAKIYFDLNNNNELVIDSDVEQYKDKIEALIK